jgi:hypothetical protein
LLQIELPDTETPLEDRIAADPDWVAGMLWGKPRPGHPEGAVGLHVIEVLANVDRFARDAAERQDLRFVALLHDACKVDVVSGGPNHGQLAARLAERFVDDERVLTVIERHDEVFYAYRRLRRARRATEAELELSDLVAELRAAGALELYLQFVRCDTFTGDKKPAVWLWLEQKLGLAIGDAA